MHCGILAISWQDFLPSKHLIWLEENYLTYLTYLTYLAYLTYLTYLSYLTYLPNLLKHRTLATPLHMSAIYYF